MMNDNCSIGKFNRLELKYLVSLQQAEQLKAALQAYVVPDEHGHNKGRYTLSSLYYDSPDLRCYWENEHGLKFRRKLRIRRYETGEVFTDESPVFLEIKQRYDRVTQKRRIVMSYHEALRLCNDRQIPDHGPGDRALLEETYSLLWQYNLRPASLVRYDRQAFVGTGYDPGLRVTFDTSLSFQARQLHLHEQASGLPVLPANSVVMEIKVNDRIPYWLTNLIAAHNLQRVGISKYCRSIEAAQNMPAMRRLSLRAESSHDVLASSVSTFSTLEQRMGISRATTGSPWSPDTTARICSIESSMREALRKPTGGNMAMTKGIVLLFAALVLALSACSGGGIGFADSAYAAQPATATAEETDTSAGAVQTAEETSTAAGIQQSAESALAPVSVEYDSDDLQPSVGSADMASIELAGDAINVEGTGATVGGSAVTITSAGTYSISGTLNDGQIIVDTQDEETVFLILNGVDITCSTSAPIYVSNAEKTVITLADGIENTVTDGAAYVFEDAESDEPDAAVFSKDDLTINGGGSLTVNASYNDGIASNDDLKITGGNITVDAVNDGIKGRDSIAVLDGTITVNAGGDGLQASNDEEAEKGYVSIEGGTLSITAGLDGIQAETSLVVSGGELTILTGGGSIDSGSGSTWGGRGMEGNPNEIAESAKGLKAGLYLSVTGGTIQIDALDDALHSNDSIVISGGDLLLASGDDGIHADAALTINGGELNISRSYEGLESVVITINDGTIHLTASDDGINASGGNSGAEAGAQPTWGQGPGRFESGDGYLYINGGYLFVDANGDGLDANGSIEMTAGTVIVNGPTNDGNGPLDYLGTFNVNGGYLVAVGSSGMAQAPSTTSTQVSVMYNFASTQTAGTMVHIETESGQEVLTFLPTKQFQSVLLSSPELENGSTYVVYSGGSSSGTLGDGLYSGGAYTGGTQVASVTLTSMVTSAGSSAGGFGGRPAGRP